MYVLELSKEHPDLPLWEAYSLLRFNTASVYGNLVFVKSLNIKLVERLGYSKSAYKVLFSCEKKELIDKIKKYNFSKVINKPYKVFGGDRKINDCIWNSLKRPRVDMKNPKQEIHFIKTKGRVHCCLEVWGNNDDFDSRAPHKRKGLKPISLKPKLARGLVNLTGCRKGTIVDPFTGTSGILIEAKLCGLNVVGYDIDDEMLKISKKNVDGKFKDRNYFDIKGKINYLVADLPYGKNTKNLNKEFYSNVLGHLGKMLGKRAVFVFPNYIDVKKLFKDQKKLILEKSFNYYVHKSMTRVICVISKK